MGKCLLYTALGLMGLMGALAIGVVNAETTTVTHNPDANIHYVLNSGYNTEQEFTAGTITITDGKDTITILDRNLGATNAGTGEESYGYYFQWGNIFGFSRQRIERTSTSTVEVKDFGPGNYWSNSTFIISSTPPHSWQKIENNNLWGGGFDSELNGRHFPLNKNQDRQGPCPVNFHVPSIGERNILLRLRWNFRKHNYGGDNLSEQYGLFFTKKTGVGEMFVEDFKLPEANHINRLGRYNPDNDIGGSYRSSSPNREVNQYRYIDIDSGYVDGHYFLRDTYAFPIRCFYNFYESYAQSLDVSFMDGDVEIWSGAILSGNTISGDVISQYNLIGLSKTGHTFSGRIISGTDDVFDIENDLVTTGLILNAEWTINQYTITFNTDGGNDIAPITGDYGTGITAPANPTKNGYTFEGRDPTIPDTMPAENINVKAKWKKKSSGWSGGGGRSSKTGDTQDSSDKFSEGQTGSQKILSPADDSFTKEQKDAYTFAFKNGITTMNTIDKANMDGYIKRGHLAKMVVNYVTNVLGREIPSDIPAECLSWTDTYRESDEIKDYAIKSCALGLMGIKMKNNEFLPNDYVTRAEFGAVISRVLWGDKYNLVHTKEKPRYTDHLNALKEEGIMTKIDNPQMQEKRGYVMIMLMRSDKLK